MAVEKRIVNVRLVGDATDLINAFRQVGTTGNKELNALSAAVKGLFKGAKPKEFLSALDFKPVLRNITAVKKAITTLAASSDTAENSVGRQLAADFAKVEPQIAQIIKAYGVLGKKGSNTAAENNAAFTSTLKALLAIEKKLLSFKGPTGKPFETLLKTTQSLRSTLNGVAGDEERITQKARDMVDAFVRAKGPVENYAQAVRQVSSLLTEAEKKTSTLGKVTQASVNLALAARNAEEKAILSQIEKNKQLEKAVRAATAAKGIVGAVQDVVSTATTPVTAKEELELLKRVEAANKRGVLTRKQLADVGKEILVGIRAQNAALDQQASLSAEVKRQRQAAAAADRSTSKTKRIQEEEELLRTITRLATEQNKLGLSSTQLAAAVKRTTTELTREGLGLAEARSQARSRLQANVALVASYKRLSEAARDSARAQEVIISQQVFTQAPTRDKDSLKIAREAAALAVKEGNGLARALVISKQLTAEKRKANTVQAVAEVNTIQASNQALIRATRILADNTVLKRKNLATTVDLNRILKETASAVAASNLSREQANSLLRSNIALATRQAKAEREITAARSAGNFDNTTARLREEDNLARALIKRAKIQNNLGLEERDLRRAIEGTIRSLRSEGAAMNKGTDAAFARLRANAQLTRTFGALDNAQQRVRSSGLGSLGVLALIDRSLHRVINVARRAASVFAEFETSLTEVRKTANASIADMEALSNEIIKLGQVTSVPVKDLAQIAGVLGQVGVLAGGGIGEAKQFAQEAIAAIKLVGQVSKATDLAAEDAAKSFGQLSAIFVNDVDRIVQSLAGVKGGVAGATDALRVMFGVMNELSNNSVATVQELNRFTENFGGVASAAGFTQAQVAALGATMADLGIRAKVGGTAFSRIIADMSSKTEIFANAVGKTTDEFEALFLTDPNAALLEFLEALGSASQIRRNDIKNQLKLEQRASNSLLKLAGNTAQYRKNLDIANNSLAAYVSIQSEADKFAETFASSLTRVKNAFTGVLTSLRPLFAIVSKLADGLSALLGGISGFLLANKNVALLVSGFIALSLSVFTVVASIAILKATLSFLDIPLSLKGLADAFKSVFNFSTLATGATKLNTVATVENTAATGANAVAQGIRTGASQFSTVATGANTVATNVNTVANVRNAVSLKGLASAALLAGSAIAFMSGSFLVGGLFLGTQIIASVTTEILKLRRGTSTLLPKIVKFGATLKAIALSGAAILTAKLAVIAVSVVSLAGTVAALNTSTDDIGQRQAAGTDKWTDSIIRAQLHFSSFIRTVAKRWVDPFGLFLSTTNDAADRINDIEQAYKQARRELALQPALLNLSTTAILAQAKALDISGKELEDLQEGLKLNKGSFIRDASAAVLAVSAGELDAVRDFLAKADILITDEFEKLTAKLNIIGSNPDTREDEEALEKYLRKLAPRFRQVLTSLLSVEGADEGLVKAQVDNLNIEEVIRQLDDLKKSGTDLGILLPFTAEAKGVITINKAFLDSNKTVTELLENFTKVGDILSGLKNKVSVLNKEIEVTQKLTSTNVFDFDFEQIDEGAFRVNKLAEALELLNEKAGERGEGLSNNPEVAAAQADVRGLEAQVREAERILEKSRGTLNIEAATTSLNTIRSEIEKAEKLRDDIIIKGELKRAQAISRIQKQLAVENGKIFKKETEKALESLSEESRTIDVAIRLKEFAIEESGTETAAQAAALQGLKNRKLLNEEDSQQLKLASDIQQKLIDGEFTLSRLKKEGLRFDLAAIRVENATVDAALTAANARSKATAARAAQTVIEQNSLADLNTLRQEQVTIQTKLDEAATVRVKDAEKALDLEQRRLSLGQSILDIQRTIASAGGGEGFASFAKAIDEATKSSADLLLRVLELREGTDQLEGIKAAYDNIAFSAKRAAFQAGKFVDSRRALEESLGRNPNSERARAAKQLFDRIREIQASGATEETIFSNIGATIALFERRAKSLKGSGPEISQIVKAAEQLAFSEEGRLQTSKELARQFQTQFATTSRGYEEQQKRLERIKQLERQLASNTRRGGGRERRNAGIQAEIKAEITLLREGALRDTSSTEEFKQLTAIAAANGEIAERLKVVTLRLEEFDKQIFRVGVNLTNLAGIDISKANADTLTPILNQIENLSATPDLVSLESIGAAVTSGFDQLLGAVGSFFDNMGEKVIEATKGVNKTNSIIKGLENG